MKDNTNTLVLLSTIFFLALGFLALGPALLIPIVLGGVILVALGVLRPARKCPTCGTACPRFGPRAGKCPVCDADTAMPAGPLPPAVGYSPTPPPAWASMQPANTGAGTPAAAPPTQPLERPTVESATAAPLASSSIPAADALHTAAIAVAPEAAQRTFSIAETQAPETQVGQDKVVASPASNSAAALTSMRETEPAAAPTIGPVAQQAITGSAQPQWAPGWPWTHLVPAGGIPAWAAPDPSRPPVVNLAERVQLVIDQRAGDWALVRAQNGWSGWVDGRRLVPRL